MLLQLLQPFKRGKRRLSSFTSDDEQRPLATLWDVGALVGIAGLVVAQGVLTWAAVRSVTVLLNLLGGAGSPTQRLVRRGVEHTTSSTSPASELLLRPVVSSRYFL